MGKDDLKLCYVLKIGYKSNGKGLYEFLFSKDPSSIDTESLGWGEIPASSNANPPTQNNVDLVLSLETRNIDFICLHELHDRAYMDGYYAIHCLAYENTDSDNHDPLYDETTLLVFHYGMKAKEVKELFMSRDILLKEVDVVDSSAGESEEEEVIEEDDEDEDS